MKFLMKRIGSVIVSMYVPRVIAPTCARSCRLRPSRSPTACQSGCWDSFNATKYARCCALGHPAELEPLQDVLMSGLMIPSPAKIDWESCASEFHSYPPASAENPVIAPSCISTRPYPSGTTILVPSLTTPSDPLVFDPRPALVPCGTAANTAAVEQTGRNGVEVFPLVRKRATNRTYCRLNEPHRSNSLFDSV